MSPSRRHQRPDPNPTFREMPATGFMHHGLDLHLGCTAGTRDMLDLFQVDVDAQGLAIIAYTDDLDTPPDGTDPHQEWIMFVHQRGGKGLFD